MGYLLIEDNGATRIAGNVNFSNGTSIYTEVPVQFGDVPSDYEQILIDRTLPAFKSYDQNGNEVDLDFTVTSVTRPSEAS